MCFVLSSEKIQLKIYFHQQGHNFHVNYIKNCGDIKAPVISVVENSTLELTPECVVIPNACAETKAFGAAKMKYKIWKSNLVVLQGDLDGCERLQKVNDDVKSMLTMFGMPTKCPIEAVNLILIEYLYDLTFRPFPYIR